MKKGILQYIGNNKLKEVPEMAYPNIINYGTNFEGFQKDLREYNSQVFSCKTYDISGSHSFVDGREYEYGIDFTVTERMEKLSDEQYLSKENQNRDNPIIGYMVKVATQIIKEIILCDGCNVKNGYEHRCHGTNIVVNGEHTAFTCDCDYKTCKLHQQS